MMSTNPETRKEFTIAPLQAVILLPEKESPEGADENRSLKPEFCFNSLISNFLLISLILHLAVVLLTSVVLLLMFFFQLFRRRSQQSRFSVSRAAAREGEAKEEA